jgi:probable addiction module antidote protein
MKDNYRALCDRRRKEHIRIMKRTKNYEESLLQALKDPEEALAYLNAALMDEDQEVFLLALKHVLKAQDVDISAFAEEVQITRQNVYHMLSKKGNPRWHNFRSIIDAMDLQFRLEAKQKKRIE